MQLAWVVRCIANMIVNEVLRLGLAWTAGVLLALVFFGGFWWTARKTTSSEEPPLWLCGSLALRVIPALIAIYTVSDRQWERLLLCLLGFVMARPIVAWFARVPGAQLMAAADPVIVLEQEGLGAAVGKGPTCAPAAQTLPAWPRAPIERSIRRTALNRQPDEYDRRDRQTYVPHASA